LEPETQGEGNFFAPIIWTPWSKSTIYNFFERDANLKVYEVLEYQENNQGPPNPLMGTLVARLRIKEKIKSKVYIISST